jgi:hypothetical protein
MAERKKQGTELVVQDSGAAAMPCTIDQTTVEGKMRALAIIGGNSVAGKDFIKKDKPTEMEIDDMLVESCDEWIKDDGEIVRATIKVTCVLRTGELVHFTSWRVTQYLRAALSMWGARWQGIVLRMTRTRSYTIEFVREGDWRD